MNTKEVRTLIGDIRLQLMQANITKEDAKNQLQNIDWQTITESPGITLSLIQNTVADTILKIDEGKL